MTKASEYAARQAKEQQQEKTKQAQVKLAAQKEAEVKEEAKETAKVAVVHQAEAQPKETPDTPLVQRFKFGDVEYEVNHVSKEVHLFETVLGEVKKRPTNGNYDLFMQQVNDRASVPNLPTVHCSHVTYVNSKGVPCTADELREELNRKRAGEPIVDAEKEPEAEAPDSDESLKETE